MTILRLSLAVLLTAACAAAQGTRPGAAKAVPAHARTGAPAAKSSDAELEKAIQARFAKSKISTNKFQVHVQGGVATIEGRTEVIQHKGTATRLARSAGAVSVVNKIQVSEEAREKAAGQLSTGRRRVQVKRSDVAGRR